MMTFIEEFPDETKTIRKALRQYKKGKYDEKTIEMIVYSHIDILSSTKRDRADKQAAYAAAKMMLRTAEELFSGLDSYNHARAFQDYLVERFNDEKHVAQTNKQ